MSGMRVEGVLISTRCLWQESKSVHSSKCPTAPLRKELIICGIKKKERKKTNSDKHTHFLSVSQGQVVFDAQGSRMAMTLIEQLQGKAPPRLPPSLTSSPPQYRTAACGLSSKCHSFIKGLAAACIHHVLIVALCSFQRAEPWIAEAPSPRLVSVSYNHTCKQASVQQTP